MRPTKSGWTFLILTLLLVAAVAALIYPIYVIRPFRAQGSRELMAALAVLQYRPFAMIFFVACSIWVLIRYWRREQRWLRRTSSAAVVLVIAAVALLSWINAYEIMFHPFDRPSFVNADQSKLDRDEKVIAVTVGNVARAYPIRIISYHHIINDVVDGIPIAATY
jgi:hypothetical protein